MNSNVQIGVAQFPSKGFILDTIAQGIGVKLPRKDIQRLIREESMDASKAHDLIDTMLEQIVSKFYEDCDQNIANKVQGALTNFLRFYTEFSATFETYIVSQKQLVYLLLKDLFIPLAADLAAKIFEDDISILSKIKPEADKLPVQRMIEWIEQGIKEQNSFRQYIQHKHDGDEQYTPGYNTSRKNAYNWLNRATLPNIASINRLVDYVQRDIVDKTDQKLVRPLFLFARLLQDGYTSLLKIYDKSHVDMLVEHFYLLLKFYLWEPKFQNPEDLRTFIYQTYFKHIDPAILNRDFYWDDYFLFMMNVLYLKNYKPNELIAWGMQRNGLIYNLDEETAFRYMTIYLPVNVLLEHESIDSFEALFLDFKRFMQQMIEESKNTIDPIKWKDSLQFYSTASEKVKYMLVCLFVLLQPKNQKVEEAKKVCQDLFSEVEKIDGVNDQTPSLMWLKSRYYAFCGEYTEALIYCRNALKTDKGRTGQHYKDVIVEGILLSAKCNSKNAYNEFEKTGAMNKVFKNDMLKVPANGASYVLIPLDKSKEGFLRISEECDRYFENKFIT